MGNGQCGRFDAPTIFSQTYTSGVPEWEALCAGDCTFSCHAYHGGLMPTTFLRDSIRDIVCLVDCASYQSLHMLVVALVESIDTSEY